MINIHFGDREIFVVSHSSSTCEIGSRLPFNDCFEMVRKTRVIVEEYLAEQNNTTFIFTGNISIALELPCNFEKSRTIYEVAQGLIEYTFTSCVRQFSKKKIFDNTTFDKSSKIPNASRLVSIGEENFNNNLTARQIKTLLNREFISSTNPPSEIRNQRIIKAVKEGGWVDALYQLHRDFFSTPKCRSGRYFVLKEVDTVCDDSALRERYLELVKLLAYKPSPSSDDGDFVIINIPPENFAQAQKSHEKER